MSKNTPPTTIDLTNLSAEQIEALKAQIAEKAKEAAAAKAASNPWNSLVFSGGQPVGTLHRLIVQRCCTWGNGSKTVLKTFEPNASDIAMADSLAIAANAAEKASKYAGEVAALRHLVESNPSLTAEFIAKVNEEVKGTKVSPTSCGRLLKTLGCTEIVADWGNTPPSMIPKPPKAAQTGKTADAGKTSAPATMTVEEVKARIAAARELGFGEAELKAMASKMLFGF